MATPKSDWITISDLRGGRNGTDPPVTLRENEVVDAVNIDYHNILFGRKRAGAESINTTSSGMTAVVCSLGRHVPTSDDTAAELWATDANNVFARLAANTWSVPTLKDAITGNPWEVSYASLNGKFFIAYQTAQDRLHCWDGSTVRRVGLPAPGAAPVANNGGSGSYAATLRYYRVRWTRQESNVSVLRSEPSALVPFTPSGNGAHVVITRPIQPSELETHWELEVSLDGATFYVLATTLIATTTYNDSAATTTYTAHPVSPTTGTYTVPSSYKFLAVDQNRLLGFGNYTSTNKQNRVWFSAVVGSLNVGDAERVPTDNYLDLDENDSGAATGLKGPISGSFFAFKTNQLWKLTPTGDTDKPYSKQAITKSVGAVGPRAIVIGEDEQGSPALYWMSDRGPYRWSQSGLEYIGHGIEDMILGPTSFLNTGATISVCHAVYYPDKRQVWFWVALDARNEPEMKLVYNVGRIVNGTSPSDKNVPSGWSRHTGLSAHARASVMFSTTIGTTLSRRLKPYMAYQDGVNAIWRCDANSVNTDAGNTYQAYAVSRAYVPWGIQKNGAIKRSWVLAKAANNVNWSQSIVSDYGEQTISSNVSLGSVQSRARHRFEDSGLADVGTVQFTWGDAAAVNSAWEIDAVTVEITGQEVD
ncbi:MAG: hypothetical protein ACOYD0_11915 [Candidatus Nanopelagicales bacterium]